MSRKIETENGIASNPGQILEGDGKNSSAPRGAADPPREIAWTRVPLRTPQQVVHFQARLIRAGARGELSVNDVYKLTIAASSLMHSIETATLERRLAALEAGLPGKR